MGAKFQIKKAHIKIQGQTFDHVLRADGKLPIRGTHIHSSYPLYPSVTALQELFTACEHKIDATDMSINV